jgi:hypothetical protein
MTCEHSLTFSGVLLGDNGRSLADSSDLPWTEYLNLDAGCYLPCFMPRPTRGPGQSTQYLPTTEQISDIYTFDPHEESEWLTLTGASAIKQEPYLLVGRILQLATMSLAKVIQVMEEDVTACQQAEATESAAASTQLKFTLALLKSMRTYVTDNLLIVRDQPRVHHLSTFKELKTDLEYLLARIEIISGRCNRMTDILLSTMSILESQKSIEQSEQVNKLTRLAFVYIPLSFISSIFGMNVKEIQVNPSIWVFFLTAIVFTSLWVCVVSWQNIKRWASALATRWHKFRKRVSRHLLIVQARWLGGEWMKWKDHRRELCSCSGLLHGRQ